MGVQSHVYSQSALTPVNWIHELENTGSNNEPLDAGGKLGRKVRRRRAAQWKTKGAARGRGGGFLLLNAPYLMNSCHSHMRNGSTNVLQKPTINQTAFGSQRSSIFVAHVTDW